MSWIRPILPTPKKSPNRWIVNIGCCGVNKKRRFRTKEEAVAWAEAEETAIYKKHNRVPYAKLPELPLPIEELIAEKRNQARLLIAELRLKKLRNALRPDRKHYPNKGQPGVPFGTLPRTREHLKKKQNGNIR